MFIRTFFVTVTIIIVSFFAFLIVPQTMPFRISFIVALIIASALVMSRLMKFVVNYEKNPIR